MRHLSLAPVMIVILAICPACTEPPGEEPGAVGPATAEGQMPDDDIHRGLAGTPGGAMTGDPSHTMGINREVTLSDEVRDAWSGVRVRVVETETGESEVYTVPLAEPTALGTTGLVAEAHLFVPDFVMGEEGITSRSAAPDNPAARVTIAENDEAAFEGWLFADMPDVHPFVHDRYRVLLEEGVPAD